MSFIQYSTVLPKPLLVQVWFGAVYVHAMGVQPHLRCDVSSIDARFKSRALLCFSMRRLGIGSTMSSDASYWPAGYATAYAYLPLWQLLEKTARKNGHRLTKSIKLYTFTSTFVFGDLRVYVCNVHNIL